MSQWIRVEFYGKLPEGQIVIGGEATEVMENLARAFGFTYIDGLNVVAEDRASRQKARR